MSGITFRTNYKPFKSVLGSEEKIPGNKLKKIKYQNFDNRKRNTVTFEHGNE